MAAAPAERRLMLLGSPPDMVHGVASHRTGPPHGTRCSFDCLSFSCRQWAVCRSGLVSIIHAFGGKLNYFRKKKIRRGEKAALKQSSGLSHRLSPPGLPGRRSRAAQALVAPAGAKLPRTLSASAEPIPRSRPIRLSGRGSIQRRGGEDGGYGGFVACWRGSANRGRG